MNLEDRVQSIVSHVHTLTRTLFPSIKFNIEYLTIFSQDEAEYSLFTSQLKVLGSVSIANNGFKYELKSPFVFENESINLVRVRKPDIHRKELGCVDLVCEEKDHNYFRSYALDNGLDIILRKDFEMIELSSQNANVYAYLVKDIL